MKKVLLIALVLSSIVTNAQYFQHLYGQDPFIGSITKNGMNTTVTGAGHLVGGLHIQDLNTALPPPATNFHLYSIHVVRTDADGRFTTPNDFNNTYQVVDLSTGETVRLTSSAVIEFSDGSGYGVVGTYFYQPLPRKFGVVYVRLDANGNVMATQGYSMPFTGGSGIDLMGLKESFSSAGDLFATGSVSFTDNGYMWALRIDQNGALQWGNLYDFGPGYTEDPKDLIESPYSQELIVVGRVVNTPVKGFWMVLDPNTGGVIQADEVQSFYGTDEFLHSIDICNDPAIQGFILSGVVDNKAWVIKTDPAGGYIWSGIYQPAGRPINHMFGYDAVGRLNKTQGEGHHTYEYYVTGEVDDDAYVFKLDAFGQPINPNALFVYDIGIEETGLDVDVNSSGTADGVTMYAVAEDNNVPTKEIYVVKAYFNGVSGCNETFEDLSYTVAEFGSIKAIPVTTTAINTESLDAHLHDIENDIELCHNTTISGGSNARIAPDEPKGEKEYTFSPNPLTQGTNYASLEVEVNTPTAAIVSIYDMLGRTYYTHNFDLTKGKNNLTLNISESNMAAGMYSVRIEGKAVNKTIMLMVK